MKENISNNISLFPKKLSIAGIILIIFLFVTTGFIILTMWNNLKEIDEIHFPMVERSTINVRLVKLVDYQFTMSLMTKSPKIVEDLKLNFDSLEQNYNSFNNKKNDHVFASGKRNNISSSKQ